MDAITDAQVEPVVRLTEGAASHVRELLTDEPENAGKALRVYVEDGGCSGKRLHCLGSAAFVRRN